MAKLFGIFTAIALALAAFIAYKNKAAYEREIATTQKEKAALVVSEARLANDRSILEALPPELAGVEAEVVTYTGEENALTKENEEITEKIKVITDKITANQVKLDEVREKTEKTGDLKELASKMRATNAELEELSTSISGSEAQLANLTSTTVSTDASIVDTKSKFDSFSNNQSLKTLKTRIRTIYPNWGFVTLASGNNAGVVTNSTLEVVRQGETIAKLLVTAVESNTSSASIVPDSMKADVTLMVGDQVVPGQITAPKPAGN